MSCLNDNVGLVRHERAHDRNHSRSSGEGSMCAHETPEQVSNRQLMKFMG